MRKYDDEGQLKAILCNGCGKKLAADNGIVKEGHFSVTYEWDYFSEKDGEIHQFDLCEECYDALLAQFKLPVDVTEQTELL